LPKQTLVLLEAVEKLKMMPATVIDQGHIPIQQIQTTARKQRQLLNNHARQHGFLLASSYLMDRASFTLCQIHRAKTGDLHMLTNLSRKKHRESRVHNLITKRNLGPSKATAIYCINDTIQGWVDVSKDYKGDDIVPLELEMQANSVEATLATLSSPSSRIVSITCVGNDEKNPVCAILVAAALETSRLFLANKEHKSRLRKSASSF
jgi:hypothetical protein